MLVSEERRTMFLQGGDQLMLPRIVRPVVPWPPYVVPIPWWHWLLFPLIYPFKRLLRPWLGRVIGDLIVKVRHPTVAGRHSMAGVLSRRGLQEEADRASKSLPEDWADLIEPTAEQVDDYLRVEAKQMGMDANSLHIEHVQVETPEGAALDTLIVSLRPPAECQNATLILAGNTVRYEHNYALKALLRELRYEDGTPDYTRRAVAFNYASVGKSTGPCQQFSCLIDNARAQAAHLLQDTAPENLTINAHSLGAMVGTTVAAELHQSNCPIRFGHDRSGSSFTEIVVGYVWEHFDRRGYTRLGQVLCEVARPIIWSVIRLANWEIDVTTPFLTIPATHTHIATLRSSKEDRQAARAQGRDNRLGDDRNIVHCATLYYAMKNRVQNGLQFSRHAFKQHLAQWRRENRLTEEEWNETRQALRAPKCTALERRNRDAHGRPKEELRSRNRKSDDMHKAYLHFRDRPPSHYQRVQEERWLHLLAPEVANRSVMY